MRQGLRSPLFGIPQPFGKIGVSLGVAPVLSAFGAGSVDNLDLDPPSVFIESTESGTCYWDFHSTNTDPGQGNGDITSGSFAVTSGTSEAELDFDGFEGQTGYVFFRVVNDAGTSNVLTSQEITVPAAFGANLITNGTFDSNTTGWTTVNSTFVSTSSQAVLTNSAAAFGYAYTFFSTTVGVTYRVDVDVISTSQSYRVLKGDNFSASSNQVIIAGDTATGAQSGTFVATAATTFLRLTNQNATSGANTVFDNVQVRQVL